MGKVIAVSNQKGGVGKTTMTVNVGKNLAGMGYKVLLIDNDPQGNLTRAILGDGIPSMVVSYSENQDGIVGGANTHVMYEEDAILSPVIVSENLSIMGASKHLSAITSKPFDVIFEFKDNLMGLKKDFDYILIDCLPSFGVLQTAAHMSANYLVIPTHLDGFSIDGITEQMKTAIRTKKRLNKELIFLGIAVNGASGGRVNVEGHHYGTLLEIYGELLFETQITKSSKVEESHAKMLSLKEYKKHSDQARQFQQLTNEIIERIDGGFGCGQ